MTAALQYLLMTVQVIELGKLLRLLRLFVNTLTDDDKYSVLNRDNLRRSIQILMSEKQKTCSELFSRLLKFILNFEIFQQKDDSHS